MLLPCNLVALNQKVKVTPMASFKDPRLGHLLAGESSYDDISCWRFASNSLMCFVWKKFQWHCWLLQSSVQYIYIILRIIHHLFILYPYLCLDQMSLARNLVDTQPRYAYTTWAPKAKFCLQKAAWNISRSRASPKRGSQGLGRRCTLSPRIGSPSLTQSWGCGQTDVYWLLEAFKLLYWGSRCSASALCETCLVFSTNWYDICGFIHGSIHEGGETTKTLEYSWSTSEGIWNFLFRCRVISQRCAVQLKSLDIVLKVNMRTWYHLLYCNYWIEFGWFCYAIHIFVILPHHTCSWSRFSSKDQSQESDESDCRKVMGGTMSTECPPSRRQTRTDLSRNTEVKEATLEFFQNFPCIGTWEGWQKCV